MRELQALGDLRDLIAEYRHRRVTHGCSGVEVYHLPDLSAYLKIGETGKFSDLARERDVLKWLNGKFPVPTALEFEYYGAAEALLISEIPGKPGSDHISSPAATEREIREFARSAANALRVLHDIPIADCPLDMSLDRRLALARSNIELCLLSETDREFEAKHGGMTTREVHARLAGRRPEIEDLVFTHGDPCMPNIIVDRSGIAGFIDLGGAGVADRYVDIAIFFRSFQRNSRIPIDLDGLFREGYGIDALDPWKMEYYKTLDDLF